MNNNANIYNPHCSPSPYHHTDKKIKIKLLYNLPNCSTKFFPGLPVVVLLFNQFLAVLTSNLIIIITKACHCILSAATVTTSYLCSFTIYLNSLTPETFMVNINYLHTYMARPMIESCWYSVSCVKRCTSIPHPKAISCSPCWKSTSNFWYFSRN